MVRAVLRTQQLFIEACQGAGYTLTLLVESCLWLRSAPRKIGEIFNLTYTSVFTSMPVVLIVGLFSGLILAYQVGLELVKYTQQAEIGTIVAATICREAGPIMTAFAFAAVIGSSFAAHIGNMKVTEEIDALDAMSINPIYYLAMPRIVAVSISLPLMTIYTNAIAILGGSVVASSFHHVDAALYFNNAMEALKLRDIYGGLLKSVIFGITIAAVACSQGMRAENGPEGVGRATRLTVIHSFILILVFDYFLTYLIYG